jgi:hypothetical protein
VSLALRYLPHPHSDTRHGWRPRTEHRTPRRGALQPAVPSRVSPYDSRLDTQGCRDSDAANLTATSARSGFAGDFDLGRCQRSSPTSGIGGYLFGVTARPRTTSAPLGSDRPYRRSTHGYQSRTRDSGHDCGLARGRHHCHEMPSPGRDHPGRYHTRLAGLDAQSRNPIT